MMKKVCNFKTLLGRKNLDFSIECLNSFLRLSKEEITLQIFDDGTLTWTDQVKIMTSMKNVSIVTKAAREGLVREKLAFYPACVKYRESSVYSYKLFDVMLYDNSDLLFIDGDVYFLKRFELPVLQKPAFIKDKQNAYSFTPGEFMNIKYPIYPRVNTGLFFFPFRLFDLSFLETLLSDALIVKAINRISWMEQTLWAFMAGRVGGIQYFDPVQVKMSREKLSIDENTVAVHLVSSYRYHFEWLKSISRRGAESDFFTPIEMVDTSACLKKSSFVVDRIRKGIFRRMGVPQ